MQFAPLLLACLAVAASDPVTVRVQDTRGGPQIHVDGKPVPPRFFYGSMNSGTIALKSAWTSHTFEFVPGEVKGTGTLHFRFTHEPGEVWLADLHIRDAKTSEDVLPPGSFATPEGFGQNWSVWPPGPANTVGAAAVSDGALHVTLKRPPRRRLAGLPPAQPRVAPLRRRPRLPLLVPREGRAGEGSLRRAL